MSEQSIGDISFNKLNQLLESLQASGLPAGLVHRLRLDKKYREAFVTQAQIMDKDMIGEKLVVEHHKDFCDITSVIKALKEKSPYSRRCSYLLKEEILLSLYVLGPASGRIPPQFPLELYAMPLYKRMTEDEVHEEMSRRQLLFANAFEALCLATCFSVRDDGYEIFVPTASYTDGAGKRSILGIGRNGNGDPMLGLSSRGGVDSFENGDRLLVKRRPAAFM